MRSSKSEKADEAVTEVTADKVEADKVEDCLTVADRPAAMVAEASETENNSEKSVRIVMNNEEEADLSLLCYLFCWNDCLVHSGKNLSLSLSRFNVSVYYYLFTTLFVYILLLQIIIFIIITYLS